MLKGIYLKRTIVTAAIIVLLVLLIVATVAPSLQSEIRNGTLQYSEELGWINWDHARPDGPREAFRRLQRLNEESNDSFSFTYHQKMVLPLAGVRYVAEVEELWKIQAGLSSPELKSVFLEVFTSVSSRFEKMQAQGAYAGLAASRESSFREGDLTGNLLAFYMAVNGESISDVQKQLTLFNTEKSLKQLSEQSIGQTQWAEVTLNCVGEGNLCTEVNSLLHRVGQSGKSARMMSSREGFYKK